MSRNIQSVTITGGANHANVSRLTGWSIRESAGTPAAAAVNLRKAAVGGQIVATIELAANGSTTQVVNDGWIACEGGCYVEVVSGTVEGVLYYR